MAPALRDLPQLLRSSPGRRSLAVAGANAGLPLLLRAAELYRRTLLRRTRVLAVVGSYGKSTTTRALATALEGRVHRWAENNTFLFVALRVLGTSPAAPYAVLEVAVDGPGQMARHARVVRPDVVVVTAIGSEHHRSLGSLEQTRAEKARMLEALRPRGVAVLNGDDPNVRWMRERHPGRSVTFGLGAGNDVRGEDVRIDWPHGTRFTLAADGGRRPVSTRLMGEPGVRAVLAAVVAARAVGQPVERTLAALEDLAPTEGRLQPVTLPGGVTLLRDEYKSSYETVATALDVLEAISARRRIAVLGEVSEPPGSQGPIYRSIGERLAGIADEAILVGANFQRYAAGARRAGMADDRLHDAGRSWKRALRIVEGLLEPGDVVLVKGRDTQRLERIALALEGRAVTCARTFCDLKVTRCRGCALLESRAGDPPSSP